MDAKIFSVWFNSTIHFLQLFLERIETRGAWIALRKYVMSDFLVTHPRNLSDHERKTLLKVFDQARDVKFPSLLDQLEKGHPERRRIDTEIMRILGFSKTEIEEILEYLYPALRKEIVRLKELMSG
jgi:hypothetical protein